MCISLFCLHHLVWCLSDFPQNFLPDSLLLSLLNLHIGVAPVQKCGLSSFPRYPIAWLVHRTVLVSMGSSSFYVISDSVVSGCSSIVCEIINILENCSYHTISVSTLQSYIAVSVSYSLLEAIFMKDFALVLNESHTPSFKANNKIICQTVISWLTKELQKYRN